MAYENAWDRWSPRHDLARNASNRRDFESRYAQSVGLDSLSTWATDSEKLDQDYNSTASSRIRGRGGNHLPPSATSVIVVTPVVPPSGDLHHHRRPSNTRWRGEARSDVMYRNSEEDFYEEHVHDRDQRRPSSRNINQRRTPSPHAIPLEPRSQSSFMDDHRQRQASIRKEEYRRNYFNEDDRRNGFSEDFEESYDSWPQRNNRDDRSYSRDSRLPRDEEDNGRYYNNSERRGSGDWIRDGGHGMKGGRMQPRRQPEYSSSRGDFSVISDMQDSQADWQPAGSTQSDPSSRGGWLDRRRGRGGGGLRGGREERETRDSASDKSSTRGSFKVKRGRYVGSASLSSSGVHSAKSRTTLSTRGTGGTDALSVLTEDRTAERAAAALVEDLRSRGFQLRGDGTIHSTGSSTFSRKKDTYGERYVATVLDDLESHREELRGSHSVDEGERYSARPSPEGKAATGYTERFSVMDDISSSTKHDSTTLTSAAEEKETIERPGRRGLPSLLINSLFDAQSSTAGTTLDNSTISTKDTMFGKMTVVLSMGDSTTNDGGGGSSSDKDKGESTNESSTLASSTVEDNGVGGGGNSMAEMGRVTWGGEMPPLTASGSRVPETVSKDNLFGLNHNISDLSSGPNVSVKPIHHEPESLLDRLIDHFLLSLRLTAAQPCRSS